MISLTKITFFQVSSIPFAVLGQLPYLTSIEIRSSELNSMDGLDKLNMLEEVTFDSVICSAVFPVSCCHPKLRRLSVLECFCIRIQARFLGGCPNLEYLHIDSSLESPILDISFVRNTPKMTHFAIAACCGESTSSFDLTPLTSLKHLEYVNLKGIPEMDYTPLDALDSLRRFVPGMCSDEQFIELLRNMKGAKLLESIELIDNDEITDDALIPLAELCPNVYRVLIFDCPCITQNAVHSLSKLTQLTCLQLSPEIWWSAFTNLDEWRSLCVNVCLDDL